MERDIHQKMKSVRIFWEWGYFPEIDVRLFHKEGISKSKIEITDIDVLGIKVSKELKEEKIAADCKTNKSTSPINRAFWLSGLMSHMFIGRGLLILSKTALLDHKLAAKKLNISLMDDQEFERFSTSLIRNNLISRMSIFDSDVWLDFHKNAAEVRSLHQIWSYRKYRYWQDNHQRQIRYTIIEMKQAGRSITQKNRIVTSMFLDIVSLFSLSLVTMVSDLFQSHFIFRSKQELDISLKAYVYEGRDNYEHLNTLTKRVIYLKQKITEDDSSDSQKSQDMSLPEWENFMNLVMNLMENPHELSKIPLVLKYVLFEKILKESLVGINDAIPGCSPLTIKLASDIVDYFVKATEVNELIWRPIRDKIDELLLAPDSVELEQLSLFNDLIDK